MATIVADRQPKYRKAVARALRKLAKKIETVDGLKDVALTWNFPCVEADPAKGECPYDGYRHYKRGTVETFSVKINYEEKV